MTIERVGATLGAAVIDLDVDRLGDDLVAELHQAFLAHEMRSFPRRRIHGVTIFADGSEVAAR